MLLLCDIHIKFAATHTYSLAGVYGEEPRRWKCKLPFWPSSAYGSAARPVILKCKDLSVIPILI